ncbi:MAG: L-2-amino-thiazoline-4-carboxylic acid hydrolase [Anaerolineales bacterium]
MKARAIRIPLLQAWQPKIEELFGKRESRRIVAGINHHYQTYLKEAPPVRSRALRIHLQRSIFPLLALYQSLLEAGFTREEALDTCQKLFFQTLEKQRKQQDWLGRLPFAYALYRWLVKPFMQVGFPNEGFEIEWVERSREQIAFNMHTCFYLNTLRKYGAPELTPIFCNADDLIYKDASPHIQWQRSQTLAKGGTHCDFRYIRKNP